VSVSRIARRRVQGRLLRAATTSPYFSSMGGRAAEFAKRMWKEWKQEKGLKEKNVYNLSAYDFLFPIMSYYCLWLPVSTVHDSCIPINQSGPRTTSGPRTVVISDVNIMKFLGVKYFVKYFWNISKISRWTTGAGCIFHCNKVSKPVKGKYLLLCMNSITYFLLTSYTLIMF